MSNNRGKRFSSEKRKKVLVTGANGFIGSFLCPRLMREGYQVTALIRDEKNADPLKNMGIHIAIGDLTKPETIQGICNGIGTVIHLAAHVQNWGTRKIFYDSIFQATKNILDEAARNECRFIYFSSFCAAGAGSIKQHLAGHREDDPEKTTGASFYCDAKYKTEKLVQEYHNEHRVFATIIRPANVFGPGSLWVRGIVDTMNKGPVFPMIDHGRYKSCFLYVENLVDGVVLALQNDISEGKTYYFRDEYAETWEDYFRDIRDMVGKDIKMISIPFQIAWFLGYLNDKLLRPLDVKINICRNSVGLMGRDNSVDSSRARNELGWKTTVSYREAMDKISDWVRNEYLRKEI